MVFGLYILLVLAFLAANNATHRSVQKTEIHKTLTPPPHHLSSRCLLILFCVAVTLHDIVHTDKSLTLVFEYLERDLKQYMDDCGAILAMNNVKLFLYQVNKTSYQLFE